MDGLVGRIKTTARRTAGAAKYLQAVVELFTDSLRTVDVYAPPGVDARPLPGDRAACVEAPRTGGRNAVGFQDTVNPGEADEGEVVLYARDAEGAKVVRVRVYKDGRARIYNENGSMTLGANGDFNINGAVISASGEITNAAGVVLGTHTHSGVETGSGNTGGPN